MSTEREGWRLFALEGTSLISPFQRALWAERSPSAHRGWIPGINRAECLAIPGHEPPAAGCTCGLHATCDLNRLLKHARRRTLPGSSVPMLDELGVLALVRLTGKQRKAGDVPADNPKTTWRARHGEVLAIHLANQHEAVAEDLGRRFDVPVLVYDDHEWPDIVTPEDEAAERRRAFYAALPSLRFGTLGLLDDPDVGNVFVEIAEKSVRQLRDHGVSADDVVSTLRDTWPAPKRREAEAFLASALEHLAPGLPYVRRGHELTTATPIGDMAEEVLS